MIKYKAQVDSKEVSITIEPEGIRIQGDFFDFADFKKITPNNHRVLIDLLTGEQIIIGMLGFSFDGFWETLLKAFEDRCLASMYIQESKVMICEGEYHLSDESGRCKIHLYTDSICILPPSSTSVRLAFSETDSMVVDGYSMTITMNNGLVYKIGKMGYDTHNFFERAKSLCAKLKQERKKRIDSLSINPPFTNAGLFRTDQVEQYWLAAITDSKCALEFITGEKAATYLYEYEGNKEHFFSCLSESLEAVGTHREIIYVSEDEIIKNSLFRMTVSRCSCVRFLRSCFAGRLIHSSNYDEKLLEYITT